MGFILFSILLVLGLLFQIGYIVIDFPDIEEEGGF